MPMTVAPAVLKSTNASMVESTTITTTTATATATATTTATTSTAINGTATQSTIDDDPLLSPTSTTAPTTAAAKPDRTSADLNRSASSNDIPTLTSLSQATDHPPHLRKAFSDVDLAHPTLSNDAAIAAAAHHDATTRARAQSAADITAPPRRRSSVLFNRERQKSFSNVTNSRKGQPSPPSTADNKGSVRSPDSNGGDKPGKGRSFLASLARGRWKTLSSSRPTSPSSPTPPAQLGGSYETLHTAPNGDATNGVPAMPAVPDDYRSFTPVPQSPVAESPKQWASPGHERRKGSVSSLKGGSTSTKRPGSRGRGNSTANGSTSTAARPSYSASGSVSGQDEGTFKRPEAPRQNSSKSLRAKMSLERLAASVGASSAPDIPPVPPTPTVPTSFTGRGFGSSIGSEASAKRRDELWGAFRTLDNDLAKFRSKAGNLRTNFMRNNILSMLHRCANHPSNNNLRPEDLDRRATILNKWWTVLLEALSGGQSQLAITNADRPLYFEAITMIMTRPEFKYPFFPNSAKSPVNADSATSPGGILNETSSGSGSGSAKGPNSRSKTSLESEESDFLTESIYHNVRNILNQNLLSQLGFCIDRMSMRHCSASLVSFSARTCAYAFVCCPDVADVLVHLWHINPDALKRVVAMYDPNRSMKERVSSSEDITSYFPPALRSLAFTSHVAIVRWLRKRAIPPITANHINWFGPWKTRWAGGDTDLFFLFVKYYHLLIAEFVSIPQLPKSKLLYIPGLVLVNTQILKVLEKTLARSANPIQEEKTSGANGQVTFDDLIDAAETTATSPLGTANTLRQMSENRLVLLLRDIIADPQFNFELRMVFVESICDLLKTVTRKTSLFDHNACFVLMDLVQEFVSVISSYAEQVNRPDLVDWDFWLNVFVQMLQSNNSLTEVRAFAFWFMMWDSVCTNEKLRERLCMDILLDDSTFYRYFNHWSAMVRAYFHRLICWRVARYAGEATPLDQKIYTTLQRKLSIIYDFCITYQNRAPLVTAPSQPAPGRQLVIVRNESLFNQSSFICLDHSFSPPSPEEASPPPKRRWTSFKSIFSSPANPRPGEVTPPGSRGSDRSSETTDDPRGSISDISQRPGTSRGRNREKLPSIPLSSFRFSLEWVDRPPWNGQNPLLFPPTVPMPLRIYLQSLNQKNHSIQPRGTASDQAAAMLAAVNLNGTLKNGTFTMPVNDISQPSNSPHLVTPSGSETSEGATSSKTSSNASNATKGDSDKENISPDAECDASDAATDTDAPDHETGQQSMSDDITVKHTTGSRPPTPDTPKNPTPGEEGEAAATTEPNQANDDDSAEDPKLANARKEREKYHEIQEDFLLHYSPDVKKGPQTPFRRAGSQRMHNLGESLGASKYAGRSLSEWAHVVNECDTHYERRREAGIDTNRMVEIPSLGVENLRR